ncbi:redoxin domain-containing protein [Bacillus sp. FJAT-50079]|uniref:redoxin domain-containing protein n=1 Tax=Bacillus sp. FJAT-50079 TaxID=2833577 RepID=UPI001BC92D35|nr:redoxin domain-containing protein [Bacillus sp. FJAT-50079]MBS4208362.1 redoxin domain-containing protein [Bacillus sp. FJAT-50079]
MKKNIFGLLIIIILVSIVTVNIVQETRAKKEAEKAQEEYLAEMDRLAKEVTATGFTAGEVPPDFELQTIDGNTIKLSDYKGKKVILNFWATWCPPCKAEMPHMENYYKTSAKDENVEIIAVNLTMAERGTNVMEKVSNFIKEYELTFPIPLDEEGKVSDVYKPLTIPTTYLINTDGLVHRKVVGPMDDERIRNYVKEMN